MRGIITVVCIFILIVGGVWWWRSYHNGNLYDGSVQRRDAAMEAGATTMENGKDAGEEVGPTPSRSDAPGTINGDRVSNGSSDELNAQTPPVTQDPYGANPNGATGANAQVATPSANQGQSQAPQVSYSPGTPMYPAPATDSQTPNAPNGMHFSGSGTYQWYRQGNLTYRVDTQSGRSCIVYATMEEWRKPYVYNNGCRAS